MFRPPRFLLVLISLFPLVAHAQSGQGGAFSSSAAPTQSAQAPAFGNQGCQPGFTAGPTGCIPQRGANSDTDFERRPTDFERRPTDPQLQQRQALPGSPVRGELPELEPTEFQRFIFQSTGRLLPRYGFNLFSGVPSTFAPVDNIPVTPDYVVGPGDEIQIRVWGQIDGEHRVLVDRGGNINIPRVGTISVSGINIQDLQGFIRNAIARNFRNFDLSVNLGQLRSIQVFIVGQARRPGSYTVSSLSTLVSALFASGGPSGTGSMRRIQLKRGDKTITEFDIYDFLAKGDKSKDARLLPGDVIFIPPEGQLVAMSGSVKVPAIYELKDKASLGNLIDLAGGLNTTAAGQKVVVERIEDRKVRRVDEFSLDPAGLARTVKDGDLISVLTISPKFDNAVTLRGNVAVPLRHPYREGMRISDLIPEKDALIVADYYTRRNLATRVTPRTEEQLREDIKRLGSDIGLKNDDKLLTEIRRAGAEINWDYALIERLDPNDFSATLLPFDLGKAVLDRDPSQNLLLKPGDVVTVFSKGDFGVPVARRTNIVVLEDEFKRPGIYRAEPGETLRQLVLRTGGVTPNAYLFGAVLTRESTRVAQQKSLDEAISRLELDAQRSLALTAQTGLTDPDAVKQQAASQQAVLARLRQLKASGRIILKQSTDSTLADIPDLALENGDRLQIPSRPSTVSVYGAVYNEGSFVYRPDQRANDYLAQAGGVTQFANSGATYILRADGSVVSKGQSGWISGSFESSKLMPGDAIVVPEDFDRTTWTKTLKDWGQILYQFGLGAAAIKVIRN